jgi:hypothetical protein
MCWQSPAITGYRPGPGTPPAPVSSPRGCPGGPGSRCPQGPAPKDTDGTTGAWVTVSDPGPGYRYLLIRRNRSTGELASCRCCSPRPITLAALVKVAGLRWTIEENFQAGKGLTGLDEHQARRWTSWYRWATLAMLAAAALTIAAALEHARGPGPADQVPLTRNEIAHLPAGTILRPAHDAAHQMRWSRWRRRHQHRARTCHHQR